MLKWSLASGTCGQVWQSKLNGISVNVYELGKCGQGSAWNMVVNGNIYEALDASTVDDALTEAENSCRSKIEEITARIATKEAERRREAAIGRDQKIIFDFNNIVDDLKRKRRAKIASDARKRKREIDRLKKAAQLV